MTKIYIHKLFQDIKGDIGLLINNVGMGYEHPEYFLDIENCAQVSRYISLQYKIHIYGV